MKYIELVLVSLVAIIPLYNNLLNPTEDIFLKE